MDLSDDLPAPSGPSRRTLLIGGAGRDFLLGGSGNDTLRGAGEEDRLFGGSGNDVLLGGRGSDTLSGGSGQDQLVGDRGGRDDDQSIAIARWNLIPQIEYWGLHPVSIAPKVESNLSPGLLL